MSKFTTDTICELAREAGAGLSCIAEPLEHPWKFSQAELERFVTLVANKAAVQAMEVAAMVCDNMFENRRPYQHLAEAAQECAAAIRARAQKGCV